MVARTAGATPGASTEYQSPATAVQLGSAIWLSSWATAVQLGNGCPAGQRLSSWATVQLGDCCPAGRRLSSWATAVQLSSWATAVQLGDGCPAVQYGCPAVGHGGQAGRWLSSGSGHMAIRAMHPPRPPVCDEALVLGISSTAFVGPALAPVPCPSRSRSHSLHMQPVLNEQALAALCQCTPALGLSRDGPPPKIPSLRSACRNLRASRLPLMFYRNSCYYLAKRLPNNSKNLKEKKINLIKIKRNNE